MQFNRFNTIWGLSVASLLGMACGDDEDGATTVNVSASATGTGTMGGDGDGTGASASAGGSDTASSTSASGGSTSGGSADDGATSNGSADEDGSTSGGGTDDAGSTGATDGDDTTGGVADTGGNMEDCEAPGELVPCDEDTTDPFQAIGLNCPGGPNAAIPILNTTFQSPDPNAWKIASQYGTYVDPNTQEPLYSPREGSQFLIISSGLLPDPDANGVITIPSDSSTYNNTGNPDVVPLPAPASPAVGSNNGGGGTPFVSCDAINDCSDSLWQQWVDGGQSARDLLWFQFEVEVPGGTHGFSFDFAYFSAEFPEYVGSTFNDVFLVWSNSETYTGNLCFINDQPCTVTALWPVDFQQGAPQLAGTGYQSDGGGTDWYNAKASAEPFETLQLTWAVFDMGDTNWDTTVIIDNWRWDCEGCVPSEVNGCGIEPT